MSLVPFSFSRCDGGHVVCSWKNPNSGQAETCRKLSRMAAQRNSAKSFEAVLERTADRLNWTIIRVPLDLAKIWGTRGQLRVRGEVNGFPFRTSLFPTGDGRHMMIVNKEMQAGARTQPGMKARFRIEPDTAVREVQPPKELLQILRESKRLARYFDSLNYSTRNYIAKWIGQGKQMETRSRRAEQIAERLMQTMEAERELPPLLQRTLNNNPKAREGWEKMPPGQRRAHLFGIFYYRNPESRDRRVATAIEAMLEYAEKDRRPRGKASRAG